MTTPVVGIDLGTTFSAIAYVGDDGQPRVMPNADGKTTTPSVVLIEGDRIVVGDVAMNQFVTRQDHVVRWIKRAIGDPEYRFQGLTPVQISSEILKVLKRDAELQLGEIIDDAVITCPAYFSSVEIENTKAAGELAGFRVREVVKEPTAAAVYYGVDHMREGETLLVCDLGGGTYDATILTFERGTFRPLGSMGDRELGGHDWTMELMDLVVQHVQAAGAEDPRHDLVAGQMLYEACERAKRDLARVAEVAIPCTAGGRLEQVTITRAQFEAETEWRIRNVVMRSELALEKAGLTWKQIDTILLVGGSSRLRRMPLALAEASGKTPTIGREPDLMVVLGAAILARGQVRPRRASGGLREAPRGGLVDVDYKRIITRSLGTRVVAVDEGRPRITTAMLIPHSTESPVSRSRDDFEVSVADQRYFDVPVIEFEREDEIDVVGNYRFSCLPGARKGDRITVTFHYDVSGIVTASATDRRSGQTLPVERLPYEEPSLERLNVPVKPRWVVFALDISFSMQTANKIGTAKAAVRDNARDLLAAGNCRVGLVTFASDVTIACRPTSNLADIEAALAPIRPTGMTAMDDGIHEAVALVMSAPDGTDRDVVLVTDGMPDDARKSRTRAMAAEAASSRVNLLNIGLGKDDVDLEFLKQLSPLSLVIASGQGMSDAITTLLTQSAESRGGLTERRQGGVTDAWNDSRVEV